MAVVMVLADVSVPAMKNVNASAARQFMGGVYWPFSRLGLRVVSNTLGGRSMFRVWEPRKMIRS